MGSRATKYDLENVTDYIQFEFFSNNLMSEVGYTNIEPLGGHKDRGRDAIDIDRSTGKVTIFTYSVREDWDDKLDEDLEKIKKHGHTCNTVVFLTTSSPTATQKDNKKEEVRKRYGWDLEFYDLERIATLVDTQHKELRFLHRDVFFMSSFIIERLSPGNDLDPTSYAEYVLKLHEEWLQRYTPLKAQHREVDAFAVLTGSGTAELSEVLVSAIPTAGTVSLLLGESGAGKTTAMWRIAVDASKAILNGNSGTLPVLINLAAWNPTHPCRNLVQDQLDLLEVNHAAVEQELIKGNCLFLIDGLNEIREAFKTDAYQELARFLKKYEKNAVLVCCRTSDYEPRMLDDNYLRSRLKLYEICRMARDQVIDYVNRHFASDTTSAKNLLSELGVDDDEQWEQQTSLVQLARIPLYLRLFIIEYEQSKQLPTTQARLVKALIDRILDREKSREAAKIDNSAKERLLSSFAYETVEKGYWLEVPQRIARDIFKRKVNELKSESLIGPYLTVGALWQEIISNNLLTVVDGSSVQWIHQLIFDYFLGGEISEIWSLGSDTKRLELTRRLSRYAWGLPCEVALSFLDRRRGADFLEQLIMLDGELARRAFEAQSEKDQRALSDLLISEAIKEGNPDTDRLDKIAINLPTRVTVQTLIDQSKVCPAEMDVPIAKAISELVIAHGGVLAAKRSGLDVGKAASTRQFGLVTAAVKRALDQLIAWTNSKNELICLYAARALWGFERSLAVDTLKKLMQSGKPEVVSLTKDVMEEYGIE